MSDFFTCDDKDTLVAYLYGEADAAARKRVDDHLRACAACADEVRELQSVRGELAAWAPPEPQLGFTIVRQDAAAPAAVLRPVRWWPPALPAWAQAAAAVLVLAAGAAIANVQVRYDASGLMISTGWMAAPAPVAGVAGPEGASSIAPPATNAAWRPELEAMAAQLRREMATAPVSGARNSSDADAVLRRVSAMIAQSEERQQQELARKFLQVGTDFDRQRRADMMRISSAFRGFEGQTGEVARKQQQMMDYIVRVSQPQQ